MAGSLLDIFYELNSVFLGIVQPQKLTDDEAPQIQLEDGIPNAVIDSLSEETTEWVNYLIGYVALLGVGALFVLIIPIAGLIFCCCKICCKKCCADTNPRDGKYAKCTRICCGIFLLIFTIIVAAGCAVCIVASLKLWQETKTDGGALDKVNNHIYSLENYVEDTIDEAEEILVESFEVAYDSIMDELNNLGEDTLGDIGAATNTEPLLEQLYNFTDSIPEMQESLHNATTLSESLDDQAQTLTTDLDSLTTAVIADADLCTPISPECIETKVMAEALLVQADYGSLPSLEFAILSLQVAVANDLEGMIDSASDSYNGIADSINETWQQEIQRIKSELNSLDGTIANATNELKDKIPEIDLSSFANEIGKYQDDVETYGNYWFYASISFSGILVTICVCYFIGLCLGACCKLPSDRENQGCTTRHASRSFLLGASLTFIFTWLHMIVTMVMFVSGGLSYTEVCRYISPLTETSPGITVIESLIPELPLENMSLTTLLGKCEDDLSLYQTLGLNDTEFNISEYLDLGKVEESLLQFKSADYEVNATLITQELNDTLRIVSTGLDSINFTFFYTVLETNVTTIDLYEFANQLQRTADAVSIESLSDKFLEYAITSEELYNTSVVQIASDADSMQDDLDFVEETRDTADLSNLLFELNIAQDDLNTKGGNLVEEIVNNTADAIFGTLVNLTEEMAHAVKYEIGKCGTVYDAIAGVVDVACEDVLDPYNLTWLAQGWTLIVLVPSLGLAIKLSRLYRKIVRHNAVEDIPLEHNGNTTARSETSQLNGGNTTARSTTTQSNGVVHVTHIDVRETENLQMQELHSEMQDRDADA